MTTNNDGVHPTWNGLGNSLQDDGLAEDRATEDITDLWRTVLSIIHFEVGRGETDRAVWTLPHLLKFKFLDTGLIRCDSRTLDTDLVLLDRLCSLDCYGIVCLPVGQSSVATSRRHACLPTWSRYSKPRSKYLMSS